MVAQSAPPSPLMRSLRRTRLFVVPRTMAGDRRDAYFSGMIDWLGGRAPITLILLATLALGLIVSLVSAAG